MNFYEITSYAKLVNPSLRQPNLDATTSQCQLDFPFHLV